MAPDVVEVQLNEVFPIVGGAARCGHKHFPRAAADKRPGGLEHSESSRHTDNRRALAARAAVTAAVQSVALEGPDVLCFVALAAHTDVELDLLVVFEVAVALALDRRVVDEDVAAR